MVVVASEGKITDLRLYGEIQSACVEFLKKYIKGFHVCGSTSDCDTYAEAVTLRGQRPVRRKSLKGVPVNRYVLFLDVPVERFVELLEGRIIRAIVRKSGLRSEARTLFPAVRNVVGTVLSQYLFYNPECNKGRYICETGACTEFDPWK